MGAAFARWTAAEARIHVPRLAPLRSGALLLRLAASRPPGRPAPRTRVVINSHTVGETGPLDAGFTVHELPLPSWALEALAAGGAVLTLATPPFTPADDGASQDFRLLGVAVDWVRVEPR
jgi:hypothetical protein